MTALVKYEAACRSLAEAHGVDEVKDIRDKAEAMRVYGIQSKNVDLEIMASEIRVRSERRLGELLIEAKAAGQISQGRNGAETEPFQLPRIKLKDIGVDKKLSSRAQKLGSVTERAFEAAVGRMREDTQKRGSRVALRALAPVTKKGRPNTLAAAQAAYRKMTPEEREQFRAWIESPTGGLVSL
jgi:hypothetical protein